MQVGEVKRLKELEPGRRSKRKPQAQERGRPRGCIAAATGPTKSAKRHLQGSANKKVRVRRCGRACRVQSVGEVDDWDKEIESGKPTLNAYLERFNGTSRREVLNAHLFTSIRQVRQTVEVWLIEYNTERPHQGLKFMTPVAYRQSA